MTREACAVWSGKGLIVTDNFDKTKTSRNQRRVRQETDQHIMAQQDHSVRPSAVSSLPPTQGLWTGHKDEHGDRWIGQEGALATTRFATPMHTAELRGPEMRSDGDTGVQPAATGPLFWATGTG